MYRIITTDGTELGITDTVNYIRYGNSGCFVLCQEEDAIGVAFDGVPYNLNPGSRYSCSIKGRWRLYGFLPA